jgi:hypothetical protein
MQLVMGFDCPQNSHNAMRGWDAIIGYSPSLGDISASAIAHLRGDWEGCHRFLRHDVKFR